MRELLYRTAVRLVGFGLLVLVVADLRWLLSPPREEAAPAAAVPARHAWKVAAMRHRIHAGMSEAQVTHLLGTPSYVENSTPPGDIPDTISLCDGYDGADGPLFVYYRNSVRDEMVVCTDVKRVSFDGTGT